VINKIDAVLEHLAVENQHDMEAMLATLDSDNPIRDEVAGRYYQGKDEVAGRYAELWIAFPDFNVFPRRFIEHGDSVVMIADYSGTHRGVYRDTQGTGKPFNVRIVNVIDFAGDKILRETIYMDLNSQLKQLGLQRTA
jgi:steroid delta-isomerase-like uncharacterized protein